MCRINGHLWKDFNREVRNQNNHKANKSSTGRTKTIKRERNFKKKTHYNFQRYGKNIASIKTRTGCYEKEKNKKRTLKN